jgi:DNA mismatch repair protein MutS2
MKMRLGLNTVVKITPSGKAIPAPVKVPPTRRAAMELDLRGKRADEVEPILDTYLNDAAQSNLQEARIIHGYATGTVRSIVREYLRSHPLAKSFRPGSPNEGGDGVTVVRL